MREEGVFFLFILIRGSSLGYLLVRLEDKVVLMGVGSFEFGVILVIWRGGRGDFFCFFYLDELFMFFVFIFSWKYYILLVLVFKLIFYF